MKILIMGESCLDVYQYGRANRLCPEAPVPVFQADGDAKKNPGMAMNVCRNLKALVDYEVEIFTNENWEQITKTRFVDERTNAIVLRLDQNDNAYKRKNIKEIDFGAYDAIIVSDYNKGFLTEEDICFISHQNECTFLDTKKILGSWAENIKYIKINEYEYNRTKHKLNDTLLNKMIITLGPQGAHHQEVRYSVPKVEIKDTSGAGDTFIAALTDEYIKHHNISLAIEFANICATKVVQKKGVSVVA